jgi:hypothetical protein
VQAQQLCEKASQRANDDQAGLHASTLVNMCRYENVFVSMSICACLSWRAGTHKLEQLGACMYTTAMFRHIALIWIHLSLHATIPRQN